MKRTMSAFTIQEAELTMGRRVKLVRPLSQRLQGETGTVTGKVEYYNGYALQVTWDIFLGDGCPRVDYFNVEEFNELLLEV